MRLADLRVMEGTLGTRRGRPATVADLIAALKEEGADELVERMTTAIIRYEGADTLPDGLEWSNPEMVRHHYRAVARAALDALTVTADEEETR